MRCVHTLVPENASDFVNTVKSPDDKPFEIKLRLDPQVHIHIKGVMMSNKRTRGGSRFDSMQNGCIDFYESESVQIVPYLFEYKTSLYKSLSDGRIHNKIDIALTVSHILILKPMPFFRQRQKRL